MQLDDIKETLRLHKQWLAGDDSGKRAILSGTDLRGVDLSESDLRGVDLSESDLRGVDLRGADLRRADLRWSILSEANLRGVDLIRADLRGANLRGVDLRGADLRGAKGILRIGPARDGYEFFAVRRERVVWIKAGCRWFSAADARAHWAEPREDEALQAERRAFCEFLIANCPD